MEDILKTSSYEKTTKEFASKNVREKLWKQFERS